MLLPSFAKSYSSSAAGFFRSCSSSSSPRRKLDNTSNRPTIDNADSEDHLVVVPSSHSHSTRQECSPRRHTFSRHRLPSSRGRPSHRSRSYHLLAILLLLHLSALPQQSHAQAGPGAACGCQFEDNTCFPDRDTLKSALDAVTAYPWQWHPLPPWDGTIDGVYYGTNVSEWCTHLVTNMEELLKLKIWFEEDLSLWNTASVTTMKSMFFQTGVTLYPKINSWNIGSWDVSNVKDMSYMFDSTCRFNDNFSQWNTSSVTDMTGMFMCFSGTAAFTGGGIGSWDVSSVTKMTSMFTHLYSTPFNEDLRLWDVASVTDMTDMFRGASSFTGGGIGTWNVSKVERMKNMFDYAHSFNENLGSWDVSSVTDMSGMFREAWNFTGEGIGLWETSKVESMDEMFYFATMFNEDLGSWDLSSVNDISHMFFGASSFNQNLCAWRDNFPYDHAAGIFSAYPPNIYRPPAESGCNFQDDPSLANAYGGPFCANDCAPSEQPSMEPSVSESPSMTPSQTPSDVPSTEPSSKPSSAPSCTPSASPTTNPSSEYGVNLWYPKWMNGDEGCRNDGEEPNYMASDPNRFLSSTLEACCKKWFAGYAYNDCMGNYPPGDCTVNLYYPDWQGSNKGCLNDGQEPYYMLSNADHFFSNTLQECCHKFYLWDLYTCSGTTPTLSNGQYYPDWLDASATTCKNDGQSPEYMLGNQGHYFSTTLDKCCEKFFHWDVNKCMGTSAPVGSGDWYVIWTSYSCAQDCEGAKPCGGLAESWDEPFSTLDECCEAKLPWVSLRDCRAASL